MRVLNFADTFLIARIAKKMGISRLIELQKQLADEYRLATDEEKAEIEQRYEGKMADFLISGFGEAEDEVINLFAVLTGDSIKQVREYSLDKVVEIFNEIIETNGKEKLIAFFTSAVRR